MIPRTIDKIIITIGLPWIIRWKKFLKSIANAKMGVNLSRGSPIKYYSSDRITQITGNGLVTLIDEKTGYRDFFNDKEMVFYSSISDLAEKIIIVINTQP